MNDTLKKKNEEITKKNKNTEEQLNTKIFKYEKENEKLNKIISNLKNNINDKELLTKTENNNQKNVIDKLKEENKKLIKSITEKEEQYNSLIDSLAILFASSRLFWRLLFSVVNSLFFASEFFSSFFRVPISIVSSLNFLVNMGTFFDANS